MPCINLFTKGGEQVMCVLPFLKINFIAEIVFDSLSLSLSTFTVNDDQNVNNKYLKQNFQISLTISLLNS